MMGLGDNIYQRAFIKQIKTDIWLTTPWPELYQDLDHVHFLRSNTNLRTQAKNENSQNIDIYSKPPTSSKPRGRVAYNNRNIFDGMRRFFGFQPCVMDLPNFGPPIVSGKYVVIRPVTVRNEWRADSRNPLPKYVNRAAEHFRDLGYQVVSVADLEDGAEWLVGPAPYADITFHKGELRVDELMSLIAGAQAVAGGIGWIVPACLAYNIPLWCICGGNGGYNSPNMIIDNSQRLEKIAFAVPDNFCMCKQAAHNCDKRISDYDRKLSDWTRRVNLG